MSTSNTDFEYHDGKSPAAWTGSIGAALGFVIIAISAVLGPAWVGVWIGAGLIVVAIIATLILQAKGYGRFGRR